MSARSTLEALHAEMLGDLQEVNAQMQKLREDLPSLLGEVRKGADGAAATVRESFTDFHGQSLALAEFIKLRKTEVLGDIERSTVKNAATTRRALASFSRSFWVLGSLVGFNLLLTLGLVAHELLK